MDLQKKDNYTLVKPTEISIEEFYSSFLEEVKNFKKEHLVLHFSETFNTTIQEILLFLNIANDFRENGISFVIICKGIDIDDVPDEINIVPTLAEAIDILELDAIERDLMNI
ncbi:hypothetical protein [Urechidicola vernalis]|uniref:Uncharacterized protein n=1 Tax=Urechidicola vernalis TaxID=3075600 RepID=A0ABU2Y3P1_9FLAO|nr:hypothetical protein [Urechidicola sp. P050]MDT0552431.1 hypothetical protein [Urechidicola sp. P050]